MNDAGDFVMSDSSNRSMEVLSFTGDSSEDVTVFLREVMRVALVQGRQRDNDWKADYIQSCLAGSALRWYTLLDGDTQLDFNQLRRALVERFDRPPSPIDTATPVSPRTELGSTQSSNYTTGRKGRIVIATLDGRLAGYCGPEKPDQTTWRCHVVALDALIVELLISSPDGRSTLLKITGHVQKDMYLGIGHYTSRSYNHQTIPWILSYCTKGSERAPCRREAQKELSSEVWSLNLETGELSASWVVGARAVVFGLAARVEGIRIWLRADEEPTGDRVRMFFEPL